MKRWIGAVLIALIATWGHAKTTYRSFADGEGRTITARIVSCELTKNRVTLEREGNKRKATIPITSLSKADQAYIKEWYVANETLSTKNLKIDTDRVTIKKWKSTDTDDAETEANNSYSGAIQETTEYEQVAYDITLQNRGEMPIKGLRIEYKIYYEQTKTSIEKVDPEELVAHDSIVVPTLEPKKKTELQTGYAQIEETEISLDPGLVFDNPPTGAEGEVNGMRARLYLKLPSGKEVMREFCDPSNLSDKDYPWDEPEEAEEE